MSEDENNYLLDDITLLKSDNYSGGDSQYFQLSSEIGAEYRLPPNYPATVLTREDVENGYNLYHSNGVSYRATDDGTVHQNDVDKVEEVVVTANRVHFWNIIQECLARMAAMIPAIRFHYDSKQDARLNYDLQKLPRGLIFLGSGYSAGGLAKVGGGLSATKKIAQGLSKANLFRKIANTGEFKDLAEPMQLKNVDKIAKDAGIGLDGVKVKIIRDPELVGKGIYGYASPDGKTIQLFPDAFTDTENLVKTLGHERMHIYQTKVFGAPDFETIGSFEEGASISEESWWQYYLKGGK